MVALNNHGYGRGSIPNSFAGGEANIALGKTSAGASVGVKFSSRNLHWLGAGRDLARRDEIGN